MRCLTRDYETKERCYGDVRLPCYKVELDARTGEVVDAFTLDEADVGVTEDWSLPY